MAVREQAKGRKLRVAKVEKEDVHGEKGTQDGLVRTRRLTLRLLEALEEQVEAGAILIEDKGSGQSLIQDLRRETGLPVIGVRPKQDKVTRLAAVSPLIEAGKVMLPLGVEVWVGEFEMELLGFPSVAHDDQVDALSQYLAWARERKREMARIRVL